MFNELDAINAIRYIGLKSIQEAKGGHVGMTISAAPITYTLFTKFININPNDGKWINRDRFVLSGGHGSMSVYPIFYMSGLFNKQDMKNFKMKDSKTPGHPEFENKKDNFIDASTGPLGQGFAMAVGMAIAQKNIATKIDKKISNLINNYTYVVCGDGDLQEGITYEAMAIAGKYQLDKLIVLHDSNKYQLDSSVEEVSVENLELRCNSNNWFYQKCSNEPKDIEQAILKAQKSKKPSFIEVETIIAEGLQNQDSNKGHHGIIGEEDLKQFNKHFKTKFNDWDIDKKIIDHFKTKIIKRCQKVVNEWEKKFKTYKEKYSQEMNFFVSNTNSNFDYNDIFSNVKINETNLATRVYLKEFLKSLNKTKPFLIATCADLASSTNVLIGNKTILENGQNLPLGIREFAMSAIMNGISLYHDSMKIIGGTFLVFSDYMKSAIRLGAMMKLPTIYAFTHDSYQVGGDGPTHQPYDQLPMLRAIENVVVHRPFNAEELRASLIDSYNSKDKTNILVLTRQNINNKDFDKKISNTLLKKGLQVLLECKNPDFVIAASGSEVELAIELSAIFKKARVISIPCLTKAIKLSESDKQKLFSAKKALITLEASSDYSWLALQQNNQSNFHLGAHTFGKSMDGIELYKEKGFDAQLIAKWISKKLKM